MNIKDEGLRRACLFLFCNNFSWSKLNDKIKNIKSINKSTVTILNFIRPKGNSVFDIRDTNGIKLLSRLEDKQNVYWEYLHLTNLNVVKSAELIQIRHCRIGKAIKTKF